MNLHRSCSVHARYPCDAAGNGTACSLRLRVIAIDIPPISHTAPFTFLYIIFQGGNPVCCAAGLAVLDVVVKEGLMEHANTTGQYLRDRVEALGATAAGNLIGKVRGTGLFIGIEFVRDRNTLEPATAETSWICSQLKRQHRILTSIDGPCDNVVVSLPLEPHPKQKPGECPPLPRFSPAPLPPLKRHEHDAAFLGSQVIKPPMVFSTKDVDTLVDAMALELERITTVDLAGVTHTPT